MTMTEWARRIRPFDRPVKPTQMGLVRSRLLKARVRAARGLPSRSVLAETVFERLRAKTILRSNPNDPGALLAIKRLEQKERHDRLLDRKSSRREAAKRRARPSVLQTKINLWKRRRDWLRSVQKHSGPAGPSGSPMD